MSFHLPFEPSTALDSLQQHLPPFVIELGWSDIQDYIIDGHVSRTVVLYGRFRHFGYTISMRSVEDTTVESLLDSRIPPTGTDPLYNGEATGFFIKGSHALYRRGQQLNLTQLKSGDQLVFVYQRPLMWNAMKYGRDMLYSVRYDDEFDGSLPEAVGTNFANEIGILQFFAPGGITMPMLVEAFRKGVEKKSRFGYTQESLRAMQGLSLAHRILRQYADAESVLAKARDLADSTIDADVELKCQVLYEFTELYLDRAKFEDAEKNLLLIEEAIRQNQLPRGNLLHLTILGSFATLAIRQRQPQRAQSFLEKALKLPSESSRDEFWQHLVLKGQMSVLYCIQDRFNEARAFCELTLAEQKHHIGPRHYHTLRTTHCLARILYEQQMLSESKTLYQHQLVHLRSILGPQHHDTLTTTVQLAIILHELDDFQESLNLWEGLYEECKRMLGENHSTARETQYQLAQTLKDARQDRSAIDILESLLRRADSAKNPKHLEVRRVLFVLSLLHRRVGETDRAEALQRRLEGQNRPVLVTKGSGISNVPDIYQNEILQRSLKSRAKGTCTWLLENPDYLAWREAPQSSLLFLRGALGTGKTMLASTVIESLQKQDYPITFFFFSVSEASNVKAVLGSLVQQTRSLTNLDFDDPFRGRHDGSVAPTSELLKAFSQDVIRFNELFCCIDAIDECDDYVRFLGFITNLIRSGSSCVKFFLTSRRPPKTEHITSEIRIIELPNESTVTDVGKVVDETIKWRLELNNEDSQILANRVRVKAEGSFMWTELTLSALSALRNESVLASDLDALPQAIQDVYAKALVSLTGSMRLHDKELLCMILNWIATATRPLKLNELTTALAVEPTDSKLEETKFIMDPRRSFVILGASFIQILSNDTVVPVHSSLVDFLHNESAPHLVASSRISIPIQSEKANEHIARTCISYLSFEQFTNSYGSQGQTALDFLHYAATSWCRHVIRAGSSPYIIQKVKKFLRSSQGFRWLDGLLTYFGKSVEDLLFLQAELSQWADDIHLDKEFPTFVLDLYRQNAARIEPLSLNSFEEFGILLRAVHVLQATGNVSEAQMLYERVLHVKSVEPDRISKLLSSPTNEHKTQPQHHAQGRFSNDSVTFRAWVNLAMLYRDQARLDEASKLCEKLAETSERAFGSEHANTFTSKHKLALICYDQRRYDEAESLLMLVVDGRKRLLGSEAQDTLITTKNLAILYASQGRLKEAETLLMQSLEVFEKTLGAEHPDTFDAMHKLANVYFLQQRYQAADALCRHSLKFHKQTLGDEHPRTLETMQSLAAVCRDQGKLEEAENLFLRVLAGYQKVLGQEHPDTLNMTENLAAVYRERGQLEEAEKLFSKALVGYEKQLGEEHPRTLSAMNKRASVLIRQKRYRDANVLYQHLIRTRERTLGKQHPRTLHSLQELADVYLDQRQFKEAEEFYLRVLAGYEQIFGEENSDTRYVMNQLARIYVLQRRYKEAESLYMRTLHPLVTLHGPDHPASIDTVDQLGTTLEEQLKLDGDPVELAAAEQMYQRVLNRKEEYLGREHISTLATVCNLAYLCAGQQKVVQAEALYRRAVDGKEKALGLEHLSTIITTRDFADFYAQQDRMAKAKELYERALAGSEKLKGSQHWLTKRIRTNLRALED